MATAMLIFLLAHCLLQQTVEADPASGIGQGGTGPAPALHTGSRRSNLGDQATSAAAASPAAGQTPRYLTFRYCIPNSNPGPAWVTLTFNTTSFTDSQVLVGASCAIQSFTGTSCDCLDDAKCGRNGVACCRSKVLENQWWSATTNTEDYDAAGRPMWRCGWRKPKGSPTARGVSEMFVSYYVATLGY